MCKISPPSQFPYHINNTIDHLLKKEFDLHRAQGIAHPLMKTYGIDAVPFVHNDLDKWRDALHHGLKYLHRSTEFLVTGAPDDIWVDSEGKLIVVDYKATSTNSEISEKNIYVSYSRQVEVYQWLLRKMEFEVRDIAYFVYCNGKKDAEAFDGKLEFKVTIHEHNGNDEWVEPTLLRIKECIDSPEIPLSADRCSNCSYVKKYMRMVEKSYK